jgi:FkbH-like protein
VSLIASLRLGACTRVGAGARVLGRPLVKNDGRIEIGRDVTIHSRVAPVRLTTTSAGTLIVGDRVTFEPGVVIACDGEVRIEDDVVVGAHARIDDHDNGGAEIVIARGTRVPARAHIAPTRPSVPVAPAPMQATTRVRALVAADFTIDELARHLARTDEHGLAIDAEIAPFDQVMQSMLTLADREPRVDVAFVWTRPDAVSPTFRALLEDAEIDESRVMAEVDAFADAVVASASATRVALVASWVLAPWRRGLGMRELRRGPASMLMRMNLRLAEKMERAPNAFVLDAQRWLAVARDGAVDPKLWHAGKIGFTSDVLAEAALDVRAAVRGATGASKKLVVVDLDDTLWGGIVGEIGWEQLKLGGHDADGEAFVELQRKLVALTRRGIALAVVSKNEESVALEAMRSHPAMVVRPDMLASHRIDWNDKADNILRIAEELNLGLQSIVFIDDSPSERARVREALPEVFVPEWPRDPAHYARALESLRCFDAPVASREDRDRNAMYATERRRLALRAEMPSLDAWIATLDLVVRLARLDASNVARATQLLNKTNQMNLRTRRMSEGELTAWASDPRHETWVASVTDRFGDAGLTGLFGIACAGDANEASLADWVLSCRVMGRRVEDAMLFAAARRARARGARELVIEPLVTAKNKPCRDFFERAGLAKKRDAWSIDLHDVPRAPAHVSIEGLA